MDGRVSMKDCEAAKTKPVDLGRRDEPAEKYKGGVERLKVEATKTQLGLEAHLDSLRLAKLKSAMNPEQAMYQA